MILLKDLPFFRHLEGFSPRGLLFFLGKVSKVFPLFWGERKHTLAAGAFDCVTFLWKKVYNLLEKMRKNFKILAEKWNFFSSFGV